MYIVPKVVVNEGSCFFLGIPEPSAEMFETVMRLNQMLMQAIWVPVNPLLQLPHINHDNIRTFWGRKVHVIVM